MDLDHNIIKSNPYFRSLSDEEYSRLVKQITILNLSPKEVLFHEGDFADAFYIVKEGVVRITTVDSHGKSIVLARISEKGFFGEQAFSPSSSPRRQASAIAQTNTVLYQIPRDVLLSLQRTPQKFQTILQKKNVKYLREKLRIFANSIQHSSYNIEEMTKNNQSYARRSIIFFQGEPTHNAYILVNGEVELRSYDQNRQLQQIVSINPGQPFGTEGFNGSEKKGIYAYTAVVKHDANVIVIDESQYKKAAKHYSLLNQLYSNFNRQFLFKTKGKIVQFRSEYLDMSAITSIISLPDKREIVCQQVIGTDIFLASTTNVSSTRKIQYIKDQKYNRELYLFNNKIVGILDYGTWEDSHTLLDLIVEGRDLTEKQQHEFVETGHITLQASEVEIHEEFVCKCMRVSYNVINNLIVSGKADLDEISRQTGASTICGSCKPLILEMLGTDVWIPCTIQRAVSHNSEIKSFQMKPIDKKMPLFKPGQYLVVKAKIGKAWVQRNYTLTSEPDLPYLEITVKKESKGMFSSWLFEQANKNLIIYVAGPYGQFTLDLARDFPIVCFMGGIGITPAIAFVRHLIAIQSKQRVYIDYSVYYAEQFILSEEFEKNSKKHSNIVMNHRITSTQDLISEQEIQKIISSIDGCHIYVCGPSGLEKLVIDTFNKMQLAPERLHVEQFIHAGAPENIAQTISLE